MTSWALTIIYQDHNEKTRVVNVPGIELMEQKGHDI